MRRNPFSRPLGLEMIQFASEQKKPLAKSLRLEVGEETRLSASSRYACGLSMQA